VQEIHTRADLLLSVSRFLGHPTGEWLVIRLNSLRQNRDFVSPDVSRLPPWQ
jgi:hypothetical protein